MVAAGLLGVAGQAAALVDPQIIVALEEPAAAYPATGISNLRGWAVGHMIHSGFPGDGNGAARSRQCLPRVSVGARGGCCRPCRCRHEAVSGAASYQQNKRGADAD